MNERRQVDRRRLPLVPEPLERAGQRRHEERRTSPRVVARMRVRWDDQESAVEAELSLGGAAFLASHPPATDLVVVAFDTGDGPFVAAARVVGRDAQGSSTLVRVAFEEVPVAMELALARWLDRETQAHT